MNKLVSFHNKQSIKNKYLKRIEKHMKSDSIIQGIGWHNGKGCAIGCTLEAYNHTRYPIELGLPEWFAYYEDRIFERLLLKEAKEWPKKCLSAIPVGIDFEPVRHELAVLRMNRLTKAIENLILDSEIKQKIIHCIKKTKGYHVAVLKAKKSDVELESLRQIAQSAAESAAELVAGSAARSAAGSAARSAAESAARSTWSVASWLTESAARSAESAARSARSVAWSAQSAAWEEEAKNFFKVMKKYRI